MAQDGNPRGRYGTAVIAATAAVLGAVAGGAVTYLGNQALDREQSLSAARGAARVLEKQLTVVEIRLDGMASSGEPAAPTSSASVDIGLDDEQLIASQLSAEDWEAVSVALLAVDRLSELESRAPAEFFEPDSLLSTEQREYYEQFDGAVRRGLAALDDLTGDG